MRNVTIIFFKRTVVRCWTPALKDQNVGQLDIIFSAISAIDEDKVNPNPSQKSRRNFSLNRDGQKLLSPNLCLEASLFMIILIII